MSCPECYATRMPSRRSLKTPVHFHQANCEALPFNGNEFDLVVSHNALHEMSPRTRHAMFAECYRVLKPGGTCIHQDLPLRNDLLDPFLQAEYAYDHAFNGEPHWHDYATAEFSADLVAAGFEPAQISLEFAGQKDSAFKWFLVVAQKRT